MPKPGSTAVRYGHTHRRLRESWKPAVEAGQVACRRCGRLIGQGQGWQMGHDDADMSAPPVPEHAYCNQAAGGRKGAVTRRARRRPRTIARVSSSRVW